MKFWNKMKKNSKGFTLVEIIVVLVILAVLAAFTIPTMLGFVNESKGKAMIAEAREVYVAAQATATEYRAQYPSTDETDTKKGITDAHLADALGSEEVQKAASGQSSVQAKASFTMQNYMKSDFDISTATTAPTYGTDTKAYWEVVLNSTNSAKVDSLIYIRNGYKVTLTAGGGTTVEKLPATATATP